MVTTIESILSSVESVFTVIAIICAGLWAYFHYFHGRLYKRRLTPSVLGCVTHLGDTSFLSVTVKVENNSLTKVKLKQKGSGVRIFSLDPSCEMTEVAHALWIRQITLSVFEHVEWIEPGETVQDHHLILIPQSDRDYFRLQVRILSKNLVWNAATVVCPQQNEIGPQPTTESSNGNPQ